MSHHSPPSSAGRGSASSPFAGTDPTLYSPQLVRDSKHRRNNASVTTVVGSGRYAVVFEKVNSLPHPVGYPRGSFVNEISGRDESFFSRFQLVTCLPDGTFAGSAKEHEVSYVQHVMKTYGYFAKCIPVYKNGMYLRFDDLGDSMEANFLLRDKGCSVEYVTGFQYSIAKEQDTMLLNEFEGQIRLSVKIDIKPERAVFELTPSDMSGITTFVLRICSAFGPVLNCIHVDTDDTKMLLIFRVEFRSIDASNRAVHSLKAHSVVDSNPEVNILLLICHIDMLILKQKSFTWSTSTTSRWTDEHPDDSPYQSTVPNDNQSRRSGYCSTGDGMNLSSQKIYRHPADQHNRVRIGRVDDGSDVRTTIMLRNIPNKMDWMTLKAIVDDACFGTYDFLYLRIDFSSGNNVGYAFVNFVDVGGMTALVRKLESRSWYGFHSHKSAEISYATIQGREALVNKFRNSSVMQETPFCRPRLFKAFVEAGASGNVYSTGTEQAFPLPDNLSKLQRSMDNGQGLFSPKNYVSMSEHRNRFSLYDRGTPRDMLQAASQFAQQRAAPVQFRGLTDATKSNIESWYSNRYGQGSDGFLIPFDCIPMSLIQLYLEEQQGGTLSPSAHFGVIGGPAYSTQPSSSRLQGLATYVQPSSSRPQVQDHDNNERPESPDMPADARDHPLFNLL
ncbi:RNA recognition motif 2-domain-containing protein [Phaeosphaeriaceae sp. PMI808]|nr:RNA recognition motif 2-domain-containing protein [Phaeosphaeriaceae sp. PMI808]